jgi:hypothetical protein
MKAAWLKARIEESPAPLRDRLAKVIAGLDPRVDLTEALLDSARATLDGLYGQLEEREAAFDLLLADGLLTLACEAAAYSDPEMVAERCRAMGPEGELGRLAERWVGRS